MLRVFFVILPLVLVFVLMCTLGCRSSKTWVDVESGSIELAEPDRAVVGRLLAATGTPAEELRLRLSPSDYGSSAASYARIVDGHVTALELARPGADLQVEGLQALEHLVLGATSGSVRIADLPALADLSLAGDGGRLDSLTLEALPRLSMALLTNVSGAQLDLGGAPAVQIVSVTDSSLTRVPALPTSVTNLNLRGNPLSELSGLSAYPLEHVNLRACELTSVSTLPAMPQLKTMNLSGNPLGPDLGLMPADYPALTELDLRGTPHTTRPAGLGSMPHVEVLTDTNPTRQTDEERDFIATLGRLRQGRAESSYERVDSPPSGSGRIHRASGTCVWRTSSHSRARVECTKEFERLSGPVSVELGTTDLAMPFEGGGAPVIVATLRVEAGSAWVYAKVEEDLVALAATIADYPRADAEAHRQPGDAFDGYVRQLATPEQPGVVRGGLTLFADSVRLWVEAADGPPTGLSLDVRPPQ